MNDLTKEARARAYEAAMNRGQQMSSEALQNLGMSSAHHRDALANANAGPKYGDKSLNPDRPLTGEPGHYLTGIEGSRCDRLNVPGRTIPDHICGICYHDKSEAGTCSREFCPEHKHHDLTGVDVDEFRKFCEEIGE